MKKVFFLTITAVVMLLTQNITAQVTIGEKEDPIAGSLLQVKDKENVTDDAANASRGIAFPRVKLTHKKDLYPMFLQDPRQDYDITSNPANDDYADAIKCEELKKSHVGLVVYNTNATAEGLCTGLNQWDGMEWNCFQAKLGNAEFDPVTCNDITVHGTYEKDVAMDGSNYLTITVNVKRPGAYTVMAKSKLRGTDIANGYNFYISGVALEEGEMTLILPGQGKPVAFQETALNSGIFYKNDLLIEGLSVTATLCAEKVEVASPVAVYTPFCETVKVNGTYKKGVALGDENKITLSVDVQTAGSYYFRTPVTNGISFFAGGYLPAGRQEVILTGTGTPTILEDFSITIEANTSADRHLCHATVHITLPEIKYAVIGSGTWSWNNSVRRKALAESGSTSFNNSPDAKVRVEGFTQIWGNGLTNATAAVNAFNNNPANKPDIILYFAYGAEPNAALTNLLADYVNHNGVLIYGTADNTAASTNTLLNGIFGDGAGTARNNGLISPAEGPISTTNSFLINDLPNDPVINGPFGNLGGRYWGEEGVGTVHVQTLPSSSVQVCSMNNAYTNSGQSSAYSVVWYNSVKNFFYFGDSTGATSSDSGNALYPAFYNSTTGMPIPKAYGRFSSSSYGDVTVYNAALELNAIAWGIKKAASNGINPH